jgi:hypothetical protein
VSRPEQFPDQKNINALVASLRQDRTPKSKGHTPLLVSLSGSESPSVDRAIEKLREDPARRDIFDGGMGEYDSLSEADASMFHHLAFFCQWDPALMEAAALKSGRVRPKWDERRAGTTWLRQELAKAAEHV